MSTYSNRTAPDRIAASLFGLLSCVVLLLACGASSSAQTVDNFAGNELPGGAKPGAPAGSYGLNDIESINLYNGKLSASVPLLKVGGRGAASYTMTVPLRQLERSFQHEAYIFDQIGYGNYRWTWRSMVTNFEERDNLYPGYGPGVVHGRFAGKDYLPCYGFGSAEMYNETFTFVEFTGPDGSQHPLYDEVSTDYGIARPCVEGSRNRGRVFSSRDGSGMTMVLDYPIGDKVAPYSGSDNAWETFFPVNGFLMMPDGTRYRVEGGLVRWIADRNGNRLNFTYDGYGRMQQVTDSLGRTITVQYGYQDVYPYGLCDRIIYSGFGGAQRIFRVSSTSSYNGSQMAGVPPLFQLSSATVWLPDGRRYQALYNSSGEIRRIELPTGGAVEYDHAAGVVGTNPTGQLGESEEGLNTTPYQNGEGRPPRVPKILFYRRLVERRVYPSGGTGSGYESRTTYSRPETGYCYMESNVASVCTFGGVDYVQEDTYDSPANGGQLVSSVRHYFNGRPAAEMYAELHFFKGFPDTLKGKETLTQVFSGGSPVRAVSNTWEQRPRGPVLTSTTTTLSDANLVSKRDYGYDQYNNVVDVYEYDFGQGAPGALIRRNHTDYKQDAAYTDAIGGAHLRRLRIREWVSINVWGDNKVALAEYAYDQFALDDCPSIVGHDPSFNAAYTTRGNLTGVTRYADPVFSAGPVTTSTRYDIAGNAVSSTDARGNTSYVSYADSYSDGLPRNTYAFPTTRTTPAPDPGNTGFGSPTGLATASVYDYWTGFPTATTDANNKTTTYQYADTFDRLTRVDLPDGGRTTYSHVDSHPCGAYVETRTLLDASGRERATWQFSDGLGRPYLSETYENQDPNNPYIRVDTRYDAMGRVWKVSNAYRTAGCTSPANPSNLWTTTVYDALGRVSSLTTADGAAVTTSYSGNTVTATDPAGKKRTTVSDALGRLTQVIEDPGPGRLNHTTTYTYDALGNLRKVDQGGQLRFFMYDALGRLIRARNPEQAATLSLTPADPVTGNAQWTMAYAYDGNGNLASRTDARGVTTTYEYDALNRNTKVRYSDGTKDIDRHYDGAANGKGRLHYFNWDASNNARFDTHLAIDEYDAMGRPVKYRQHFFTNGSPSPQFLVTRAYDKAGNVVSQTYPSGHAVSYSYDAAGRPAGLTGNLGDGVPRTYAADITYSEDGGLQQERFGTQTPLYHKRHYNRRGQLFDIRLSTVPWAADQWNWNRGALLNYFSSNYAWEGDPNTPAGPDNNGNVLRQQHWVPADDAISGYTYTQDTFAYDQLNRLASVSEVYGGPWGQSGQVYAQVYDYDQWGNRTINAGSWGVPNTQFDRAEAQYTNRLYAPGDTGLPMAQRRMQYDAAGNLTFDNYTGQGARLYDAENRLKQAQDVTQNWSAYTYDADGRRVKRANAYGEWWQVYGPGGELLAEYRAGAAPFAPSKEYGYRGGDLLVTMSSGDDQRLRRFVTYLYYGALQRDPTTQELQDKVNQLASAGAQGQAQLQAAAAQIARSLFTSTNYETSPYRSDRQYVSDLYYAYLQRAPDDGGLDWWAGQVAAWGREHACNAFEGSSEFQAVVSTLYGGATSDDQRTEAFINRSYLGAYGRAATPAELQQHRGALNAAAAQGLSQVQAQAEAMGRSLFASQVGDGSITHQQFVINLYEGFLHRGPDAGGLNFWTSIAGSHGRQFVLDSFATSPAYRELSATLYRETFWLVTDHLGTPRMLADRTGSLAGIKRHDYLPFGEELFAGTGSRTTAQGYSAVDNVRQHFAGKERDAETGLDYFLARYYSASLGRFTSPDEFKGGPEEIFDFTDQAAGNPTFYADPVQPQSLNKYQYAYNNPLRYVDPDGHQQQESQESAWDRVMRYLSSVFNSKVDMMKADKPHPRDKPPAVMGLDGDKIAEKHFDAIVQTNEVLADVIEFVDPFGGTSVVRNAIKGNNEGAVIAMVGMAVGGGKSSLTLREAKKLVGMWGKGSFNKTKDLVRHSFKEHGAEVGAKDIWQFMRKAANFNTKGAFRKTLSDGKTRYWRKDGTFIIKDADGRIISYGRN